MLILEFLLLICGAVLSIWWRRPVSRFQKRRVPYRGRKDLLCDNSKRNDENEYEIAADFVVVGGGPGGLGAARTLLQSHSLATVVLIESGSDPMPSSLLQRLAFFHSPACFSLFHTLQIAVHRKGGMRRSAGVGGMAITSCKSDRKEKRDAFPSSIERKRKKIAESELISPSFTGEDWFFIAARPLCGFSPPLEGSTTQCTDDKCSTSEGERTRSDRPGVPSSSLSTTRTRLGTSFSLPSLIDCTAFPQGRGLGGTALCGWGLGIPSMFRRKTNKERIGGIESAENLLIENGGRALPTRPSTIPSHPISSAFSSVLARTKHARFNADSPALDDILKASKKHRIKTKSTSASAKEMQDVEASKTSPALKAPEWRPFASSSHDTVVWNPCLYQTEDHRALCIANGALEDCSPSLLSRLFVLDSFTVTELKYEEEKEKQEAIQGRESSVQHVQAHSDGPKRFRVGTVVACGERRRSSSTFSLLWSFIRNALHRNTSLPWCVRIRIGKGVVLAAGLMGTPRLLSCFPVAPSSSPSLLPVRFVFPSPGLQSEVLTPFCSPEGKTEEGVQAAKSTGKDRAWKCRDAVGVPLLYKANAGVTADDVIRQAHHSPLLFTLRSLFLETPPHALTPFADLICSIPLSEEIYGSPHAELLLFVLPFGARIPTLLDPLGVDRLLGSYRHHAVIFYVVFTGIDGLVHEMEWKGPTGKTTLEPSTSRIPLPSREGKQKGRSVSSDLSTVGSIAPPFLVSAASVFDSLRPEVMAKVEDALAMGIRIVRECTREKPLSLLLQGEGEQEAMDFTLLSEDPVKAKRLAQLMFMPLGKMTIRMKKELVDLVEWGHGLAAQKKYIKDYITRHTQWMGFGSGTSEDYLEVPRGSLPSSLSSSSSAASFFSAHSFFVKGLSNMVVGDCSAITTAMWKDKNLSRMNALLAGNIATAMDTGILAARQLSNVFKPTTADNGVN